MVSSLEVTRRVVVADDCTCSRGCGVGMMTLTLWMEPRLALLTEAWIVWTRRLCAFWVCTRVGALYLVTVRVPARVVLRAVCVAGARQRARRRACGFQITILTELLKAGIRELLVGVGGGRLVGGLQQRCSALGRALIHDGIAARHVAAGTTAEGPWVNMFHSSSPRTRTRGV